MISIQDKNQTWTAHTSSLDLPLQKGLSILIDPAAIQMNDPATPQPTDPIQCVLVDWRYRIPSTGDPVLELTVEQPNPSWFDKVTSRLDQSINKYLPTEEKKFKTGVLLAILVSIPAALAALIFYIDPDLAWELAGRNLRWIGGWTLFLVVAIVLPARLGLNRGPLRLQNEFFRALFLYAALGLALAWGVLSRRPSNFHDTPQDYANYAKSMAAKFSASYWPILLAALPWAAAAFKIFGFEAAEKTVEALRSTAKKD